MDDIRGFVCSFGEYINFNIIAVKYIPFTCISERAIERTQYGGYKPMNYEKMARKIESHFETHGAPIRLKSYEVINNGERVIYEVKIKEGTMVNKVLQRTKDIQAALELPLFILYKEGKSHRLAVSERPIIENSLRKMLANPLFPREMGMKIPIALGYDIRHEMYYADLSEFPHALYGGDTQSGKTLGLICVILSIAAKQPVNRVNLIIIDTCTKDLDCFAPLPHLSHSIVKDAKTAVGVMNYLDNTMKERANISQDELRQRPAIVCVIDEYISLIGDLKEEGEKSLILALQNLLRSGRHSKIHMVLATHEPTKEFMQIKKTNLNAHMVFGYSDSQDTRSLLGASSVDKPQGKGAMSFKLGQNAPVYLQGAYISDEDIDGFVSYIASKSHDTSRKFEIPEIETLQSPTLITDVLNEIPSALDGSEKELADIIFETLCKDKVAADNIRKIIHKGRSRADEILEKMVKMKLVTEKSSKNQPRTVLVTKFEDLSEEVIALLERNGYAQDDIKKVLKNKAER
jgi:S-DNA-T family DNA segregation ATPase FtsK/SpoIIIE